MRFIKNLDGRAITSTTDRDGTKYTRDVDMVDCVLTVMAAVENKTSLSIYDNEWLKKYLFKQACKHRTPHHLECNRIVKVMMDRAMLEMKKMIK